MTEPLLCTGCGTLLEQSRCLGCLSAGLKYGRRSGARIRHNAKRRKIWKKRRRERAAAIASSPTQQVAS